MNRRHFLSTSVAAGVSTNHSQARNGPKDLRQAMFMGIAKAKKDLPRKAQLKIEGDELRILQFTDIHFFCDREKFGEKADLQTVEDMERMIQNTNPHLIAITGDLWSDNPRGQGQEFFDYSLKKITSLGKPWLFNWGNHDRLDDYAAAQVTLTEAKNSLYRGGHDGGNYRISITNSEDR
ncbi:metallophosphoesterase, partial [Akkermansiaceae bacterium]|nr:metallophosphoesterase [Akkermansiaceae bacterium]